MPHPKGYSKAQIALHWVIAVLVAAQYLFHDSIVAAWAGIRKVDEFLFEPLILAHVAGGLLILALVAWRLTLRLRYGAPPPTENEPGSLKTLSHIAHWSFFGLLAALSVSGGVAWFANIGTAAEAHNLLKIALLALIVLHVLAVPFHRIVLKNNVMLRMERAG
ncbi:cytochrome b [Primorskyibacter sp. 2E233]|uniref:cytochrome b n=1 Tax=Primorskyibacter sp. 2E233 TaxID=3413431 RepID=UPI003BF43FAC